MTISSEGPGPDAVYRDALLEGRFIVQRCGACGKSSFPPRVFCKHCGEAALEWITASGDGVVYATSAVRNRPDKGGDHNVSLVDLAEGVRMLTRVDGVGPTEVPIGAKVKARIVGGEVPHVVFDIVAE
ncbi:MAG: Zn-ribbon domain-containing OB-fold protein [Alphaproteobacteria bacterium]